MRAVMLAPRMALGYGVSEAIAMQVRHLRALGVECVVGCQDHTDHYEDVLPTRVSVDAGSVADLAADFGADVIVAHGTPFFEVLPALTGQFRTIAYEYGDPTPGLFTHDAAARERIAQGKRTEVYPHVSQVAAISDFIRHDIRWPAAHVIRLGVDHIPDLGAKPWIPARSPGQPLRVGALMRLGHGEARYKGHDEMLRLASSLDGAEVRFELMGRGTDEDARRFREAGFRVHLNADDEARARFLRDIDVFVTTSLWEGTNLPLVEAEAMGTPGLAPDTGAHPEFTPLVFDSIPAMRRQLLAYLGSPDLLAAHGRTCHSFVRSQLTWTDTAVQLFALMEGAPSADGRRRGVWRRQRARAQRLRKAVDEVGVREIVRYHSGRLRGSR